MVIRKKIIIAATFLLFLSTSGQAFADIPTDTVWTKTNLHAYLYKSLYTSSTSVAFKLTCTSGSTVADSTCPGVGYFVYTLTKKHNPTSTFPYYTYEYYDGTKQGIARTKSLPDYGWNMYADHLTGTHGTDTVSINCPISKVMTNTVITFTRTSGCTGVIPANVSTNPLDDPPPTVTPPAGGTSGTTEPVGGPLEVGFNGNGIPTVDLDSSRCPNGSTTYTSGILKGVPCDGTLKTLEEALIIIKNVVRIFLLPIVGTIFIIMLLAGGILYITSRGNQQQLDRAKKTLTAAIVGLLIVTLSYTLIIIFAGAIGGAVV